MRSYWKHDADCMVYTQDGILQVLVIFERLDHDAKIAGPP